MGMNFFLRSKPCETCGVCKKKIHIGKSSHGWQFHFRGYQFQDDCDDNVLSYQDWLRRFDNPSYQIVDEDNDIITPDEFKEKVRFKRESGGLNNYNICTNQPETDKEREYLSEYNRYDRYSYSADEMKKTSWKDDEGHPFTDREFS